ncbi:MAG: tetratricopeptide repeat protein [Candidatus Yanofskybacteria bacterium]|nr:tetratricopeptide repeat protein [Candidatus Yanofskybacteria bacterium]
MKVDSYEEDFGNFSEISQSDSTVVEEGENRDGSSDAVQYQEEPILANVTPLFRTTIRRLVYSAVFILPLWFLPWTADILEFNKQTLLIAVAGIGLVLYLVDIIRGGIVSYKPTLFYFPVAGIMAASAISVIFSVNKFTSLFGVGESRSAAFVTVASLAVLFFLAVNVIEDRGNKLKKIVTASLALAFIFGVLQVFGIFLFKGTVFASRAFNSVGSLNSLGILAALSLVFFIPSGIAKKHDDENLAEPNLISMLAGGLRYIGIVSALLLVILINWWPVWVITFISLLTLVYFDSVGDARLVKNRKMKLFAMPMVVIVLGVFLMLINFNWTSLKSKLPVEVAPSHKTSWKIDLNSLRTKPSGYGAENFAIAYDKFKPTSIANSVFYRFRFSDSASELYNSAAEGGFLAILSFIALLWFYWKEMTARIKDSFNSGAETSAIWAASFGLLVAYFLYPFNVVTMAFLFLLLALIVLTSDSSQERTISLESDAKLSFAGSLAFIMGLVLVLVAGYFTTKNYAANISLARALENSNLSKSIEYFVKSANGNPNDTRAYRLLSQAVVAQLAEDLKKGPQKGESRETYDSKIQNQIASAVSIALRATDTNSADSQNWINRGLIYENIMTLVSGANQAAVNMYNESLTRNPADPNTYLRIGNVYLSASDNLQRALNNSQNRGGVDFAAVRKQISDDLVRAEENYKKAISFYNNFGQALFNLAVVYDRQDKLPDAIKQFEKLRAANPKDPSVAFQLGLLYYRNNQKNNAFTVWQQAVILFPNYSNARWYLSLVFEERGDLDNALKQVEEIEKFNPDNELIRQRLTQLRSGKRTIPPDRVLDKKPLDQ